MSNIKKIAITGLATTANGISLSQTPSAAGNLTITGSFATGGVATLTPASRVSITSAANISNRTFTITGTDRYGYAQSEVITGPNIATVFTNKDFLTVTQVAISGAAAGAVTVGTNGVASSAWYPADYRSGLAVLIYTEVSTGASLTYTVESTATNLNDMTLSTIGERILQVQNATVFASSDSSVVAASTNQQTNFLKPPAGIRITLNSWTGGTATMTIIPNDSHMV
jgi:hypothetical protein